eukprot:jgi/Botrbrau1/17744/Bobra.0127s0009.2
MFKATKRQLGKIKCKLMALLKSVAVKDTNLAAPKEQGACMAIPHYKGVGPLRGLPHELLVHVFPGLPQSTVMALSRSSTHCRQAARQAIPRKRAALLASIQNGCLWATPAQLRVLGIFLQRFAACSDVFTDELVGPNGTLFTQYNIICPQGRVLSTASEHATQPGDKTPYRFPWDPPAMPFPIGSDPGGGAASANYPWVRVKYEATPYLPIEGGDGGHEPDMQFKMVFHFGPTGARYIFMQQRLDGLVVPDRLFFAVRQCKNVELAQTLALTFQQFCPGLGVDFAGPVRSLRDCAILVAGCPVIFWNYYHTSRGNAAYWLPRSGHKPIDEVWAPTCWVTQSFCCECGGQQCV